MGNKILRPSELQPNLGFTDDQISYLQEKFEILCDENKLINVQKIAEAFQCGSGQAFKILNYIDFEGQGEVDFYEFTCAAASLHQNDDEALQFLYDLFSRGKQLDQESFDGLYGTVFRYLKELNLIKEDYSSQTGQKKFVQYDYNKNGSIGFDQFKSMLQNDYHCRMWMQTLGFSEGQSKNLKEQKPLNHQNTGEGEFLLEAQEGEQAGSTPSWVKTINYMAPEGYQLPSSYSTAPNTNLDIQYVYGYRSYDTKNNLKYNPSGDIVYHTAGCGILLNKTKNTMKVTTAHNDDVTCLDLNKNKNLVVTGEMGKKPSIIVWDSTTLETKAVFRNKLQKSIATIAISKSGKLIAATSMNDNHEIAIYDLNKNGLVAYGRGPRSTVYAIKFNTAQDELICACAKQVVFVKFLHGKIECKRGVFGKAPLKPNLSIALLGDAVVTSMSNGVLGYWKGNFCSRVYKEHSKGVDALCQRSQGGIISGDWGGNIILWSSNMSKQRQISLEKILVPFISNDIKIIALDEQNNNILVGTRGGEVIEVEKGNKATVAMQGHYDKQLWGLTVMSNKREFITGGEDKLLIKWDMEKRRLLYKKKLDYPISSIDINKAGMIAVGHKNGVVNFYDSNKLDYVKRIANFKNPDKDLISIVKFSTQGSTLAVGYCPPISKVYLYDVDTMKKIGVCKGSPSRINSVDFSKDGNAIMINNTSYEILFYNATNGSQMTSATAFREEQFSTMTARFSWHTQGIWPPCADGSDINAVDRSNNKKILATGDDFSKVKLFRYPVAQNRQIYSEYKGHSSHITNLKWSFDDKYLISTGGLQKSIIQWEMETDQDIVYQIEEEQIKQKDSDVNEEQEQYEDDEQNNEDADDGQFGLEVQEGEQALAIKPFLGQVKNSTPLEFKTLNSKNIEPVQDLEIKHAWGIRNQYLNDRVRNQLRYSNNNESCLFITASLGIQMDLQSKKQKFYRGQQDDLISFSLSKDKRYCATGQMAQINPKDPRKKIVDVHVWDAETKERKAKLSGFHQRAVVIVQFSPSGSKLLTIGQDDKNSLAVYDWEVGRVAWSSPVDGAKVTGAAWKNQKQYMTVGLKHVKYWNGNKGRMCKIPGKWDPMTNVVYWNDKFVSGGSNGTVYLWSGNNGIASKGHEGRVDCLSVDQKGNLYSGCSKGIVIRWKYSGGKLVADQKVLNMSDIDSFDPGVLSLDFSPNNLLVCTNSSSIYQIPKDSPATDAKIIMQSHFENELWGQAWSPDSQKFVTGGDDKTIRVYDANSFDMVSSYKMKQRIRGVDWQPSKGQLIIAGDYKGKIYLFNSDLQLLDQVKTKFSKTRPRQQPFWIEDIKFSPDGKYVAFGAHGGASHLQIYEIEGNKLTNQKVIKSLITSALLSVDWSQDSNNLAIVSQAYQLQFTDLTQRVNASAMRDVRWASWSGKFGAFVQQIHQGVDYSNINAVCMNPSRSLIATGGDDQRVRLFNYPVIIPRQKNKDYIGHSSHVTKVRFSKNEQYLLSEGGNDRTIILWEVKGVQQEEMIEGEQDKQEEDIEEAEQYEGLEDAQEIVVPRTREQATKSPKAQEPTDQFGLEQDEGEQFMAVKPWIGAIKQPTTQYYRSSGKAPNAQLNLEYAHGYRTKDCRNNLIYLNQSEVCYHTAGLGVIMKIDENPRSQKFFNMHTDDVISMSWNKDKTSIFTGQMGAKPVLYQWNSEGSMIQRYKGAKKGVSAIGANQKFLAAAGLDDNHYIYLFQVASGKMIGSEKGGRDVIIDLKWIDEDNFVTIGVKHYKHWTVSGKSMKGKTGIFGKNCNILCSMAIQQSKVYVGASDGALQQWSGNQCSKSIKAHTKAIHALCIAGNNLLAGSSDGIIKILSLAELAEIAVINCGQLFTNSVKSSIRAIDVCNNKMIVGTLGSEIYQLKTNQNIAELSGESQFRLIGNYMNGHFAPNYVTNQVWGLNMFGQNCYSTASDDGTIRLWDISKRQQMDCASLDFDQKLKPRRPAQKQKFLPDNCKGRCIATSESGDFVVGCKDGTVRILNGSLKPKYCHRMSKKQISHIKFSPDGGILAIGAHDGRIYLFNWNDGKIKLKSRTIKHNSYIKHLDFSRDGNVIHSTCGAYQLLFWDVSTGKQITSGATMTRDEEWASWNITLGWPVQGVFEQYMDGTDINSVDRSKNTYDQGMRLLASADDRGQVRLLEYPCVVKNSSGVIGRGHSSHVTTVLFNNNDEYLLSTGGQDQTILQWKIAVNM